MSSQETHQLYIYIYILKKSLSCNEKLLLCIWAHASYSIFTSECTVKMLNCWLTLSTIQIKMLFLIQSFGVYFNYNMFWSCFLNPCKWLMQIILYLLNLQCLLRGEKKNPLYSVFLFYFYFFILCVFKW